MILEAKNLKKDFPRARKSSNYFTAVYPVDFVLNSSQMVEITGRSGSGKSTFLNMLSGMLTPTSGEVFLEGENLYSTSQEELARVRNEKIGLIPQGHTALLSLTILENVLLPFVLYHKEQPPVEKAKELLETVGIASLMNARPNELSGGELRRMAVARAMVMSPKVIMADEPTAGLDGENVVEVMKLLRKAADEGTAVLMVTHESEAARFADKIYTMDGGKLS